MPKLTVRAYLGLGSNMGDSEANIQHAVKALDDAAGLAVDAVSPIFRTEPQGMRDQAWFANCVARVNVDAALSPEELLDVLSGIEAQMGRVRTERWGPRTIDIDILLYGDLQWDSPRLQIPHPRMFERAFVLVPLMHLAPEIRIRDLCPSQWLSRLRYELKGDRILQATNVISR
ncbi:MAG: 2-amino-4-hydroxy-6-hydroxymethyldihydropteridine diphosphokinase [Desulfomicrobium sp.]|nr:2-amino-4-hydroxy-6-hydroxymethyldihydropteridine diphosphokinase [Desulfomicrobium sp.]MDP3428777.1 2-amino-4-hydroxy-6-hydroxymethyldihydropteridine diphosphokinase [Desulfomicrobium sp.]